MARTTRILAFALLAAASVSAQTTLSDLPDLSTATRSTSASSSSTPTSTSDSSTTPTSDATSQTTDAPSSSTDAAAASSNSVFHLTALPTIAGAGIPTLYIPYTAGAPFMQKSRLPQGTVFIAVGATLAAMAVSVLLWRALVAWSVNRSVRKAALASMNGSDYDSKRHSRFGGGGGGGNRKPGNRRASGYDRVSKHGYKDANGSSLSLDALTSSGKPMNHAQLHHAERQQHSRTPEPADPASLFFSPTAKQHAHPGADRDLNAKRSSAYLPAGYYASTSAAPAGGAGATTIGGSLAPSNNRYSRNAITPSPPPSSQDTAPSYRHSSRDGLRGVSRDGYGAPTTTRHSYADSSGLSRLGQPNPRARMSMYEQPSSSSLAVGTGASPDRSRGGGGGRRGSADVLGTRSGSRAPSAYLEDLYSSSAAREREI